MRKYELRVVLFYIIIMITYWKREANAVGIPAVLFAAKVSTGWREIGRPQVILLLESIHKHASILAKYKIR